MHQHYKKKFKKRITTKNNKKLVKKRAKKFSSLNKKQNDIKIIKIKKLLDKDKIKKTFHDEIDKNSIFFAIFIKIKKSSN